MVRVVRPRQARVPLSAGREEPLLETGGPQFGRDRRRREIESSQDIVAPPCRREEPQHKPAQRVFDEWCQATKLVFEAKRRIRDIGTEQRETRVGGEAIQQRPQQREKIDGANRVRETGLLWIVGKAKLIREVEDGPQKQHCIQEAEYRVAEHVRKTIVRKALDAFDTEPLHLVAELVAHLLARQRTRRGIAPHVLDLGPHEPFGAANDGPR